MSRINLVSGAVQGTKSALSIRNTIRAKKKILTE
jgi:hypothetical protein